MNQNIEKLINLLEQKKYQQAYDHITQIQQVPLINAKIAYDIATCLFTLKKYDELASVVQQVETQNPKNPHLFSLYILLAAREDIDNIHIKLRYLRKAIQLNPNDFTAYYNIGCHLKNRHKDKMAKKFFKLAQERASDKAEIYLNLGLIAEVEAQGKKEENYYLKAIALQPDLIEAHLNLGMCYLNSENYQQGWSEYEWRLQLSGLNNMPQIYQKPCWQGESLENKTLLIVCEQGYGDAIQFARYIPLIQKSNNKILLRCRQPLKALMQTVKGLDQCFTSDEASPVYDYYCPLLSLPKIFNTNAKTIPVNVPYFSIETKRKKHWQNYFKRFKNTFNIGINWSGNIHNKINYYRKTTPDKFAQLSTVPNIKLFCLNLEASKTLCEKYGFEYVGDKLKDFAETAACIAELDLIISTDTALVHLAGALNLPTWVLIARLHDWRWQETRLDNPWYPSMKLYRQAKLHDWQPVFDCVKKDLLHCHANKDS